MEITQYENSIYVNYDNDNENEIKPGSFEEYEFLEEKLGDINAEFIEFERHQGGYGRSIYHKIGD